MTLDSQVIRFVLMGALSTGAMYGIYIALNHVVHYQVSYFISYILTVVLSYFLNTRYVFKVATSWKTFLQFPLVYVVQYVGGAVLLEVLVHFGFSIDLAPLLSMALLLPLTFWLSRLIMH